MKFLQGKWLLWDSVENFVVSKSSWAPAVHPYAVIHRVPLGLNQIFVQVMPSRFMNFVSTTILLSSISLKMWLLSQKQIRFWSFILLQENWKKKTISAAFKKKSVLWFLCGSFKWLKSKSEMSCGWQIRSSGHIISTAKNNGLVHATAHELQVSFMEHWISIRSLTRDHSLVVGRSTTKRHFVYSSGTVFANNLPADTFTLVARSLCCTEPPSLIKTLA